MVYRILAIPMPRSQYRDRLGWHDSVGSKVSMRDIYKYIHNFNTPYYIVDFGWIWKLEVVPWVKVFWWKLFRGCLPY